MIWSLEHCSVSEEWNTSHESVKEWKTLLDVVKLTWQQWRVTLIQIRQTEHLLTSDNENFQSSPSLGWFCRQLQSSRVPLQCSYKVAWLQIFVQHKCSGKQYLRQTSPINLVHVIRVVGKATQEFNLVIVKATVPQPFLQKKTTTTTLKPNGNTSPPTIYWSVKLNTHAHCFNNYT